MNSTPSEVSQAELSNLRVLSPHYIPQPSRIESLDILKGIAVLTGLFVSVYVWGGFSDGMQNSLVAKPGGIAYRFFATVSLLLEGKMQGLVSLAFGAGIILYFTRPHAGSSLSVNDLYVRRNMWLILFGVVNAIAFLWPMDIVFHLGIMGLLLFPFPRMAAKWLLVSALCVVMINTGKNYWNYHDDQTAYRKFLVADSLDRKFNKADSIRRKKDSVSIAQMFPLAKDSGLRKKEMKKMDSLSRRSGDTLTHKQARDKQNWEGIAKKYKWEKKNDSGQIKALQERSWKKIYDSQLGKIQGREAAWFYKMGVWEFGGIMLLGMWLFKLGFFNGRFSAKGYLSAGLLLITLGLLCGWYRLYFLNASILDYTAYVKTHTLPHTIFSALEKALLVPGYACLVMFMISKGLLKGLMEITGAVGRMALSNYFLQSVFFSIIFYGFGMGYYARVGQFTLYFLVLQMIIVQVVFSIVWLKFYHFGPMEWLLRSLVHGKRIKNRRRIEKDTEKQEQTLLTV